ncbi:MAG: response regulator, partial [Oleibacter sp.]|nr:response regulator [Thalassolituus sp.]
ILDLSKIDANKLILENISFNLRDVIEEAQQMVAPDVAAKNISLLQHLDPSLPEMLCGDRLRLKQVLTNLISNAVKFTPQGEVKVAVYPLRQESDRITIQFDITDTGIGLTQEQQKVLFRAFSQADTGISRQYGGTGLGLIISKALVSAMKGDIRIESTPGLGSIFSFTIEADINNESFETPSHLENLKVFVLGEEDIRCSEIMGLLQRWKADVTLFETTAQLSQYHQNWLSSDDSSLCDLIVVSMDRSPALLGALNLLESYAAPFIIIADSEAKDHELSQRFPKSLLVRPYPQQRLLSYIGNAINKKIGHEVSHQRPNFTRAPVIMAVDDHEANLKLLITLLAELGIPVLAARSGYEAVAAVEREHVDLVLMDIQMPGMSGTEATQRIRELPGKSKLPIIAVTAHAMADERRALIDAGMSDYQTKPISIEQLALVIERWTGYRPASLDAEVLTYNQSNPTVSPVFDPNKAMSLTNNNLSLAVDLFSMFLASLDAERESLVQYWESESLDELLESVHRLHGTSRYCGVPALRNALERFESLLKANHTSEFPKALKQVMNNISDLQHWIEANDWQTQLQQVHFDNTANA